MAEDHFDDPTFTVELLCKDGGLAVQMAERAGVRPRLAGLAHDLTERAKASGLAHLDTSALYTMFRDEIQATRTHTTTTTLEGSAP
jgi:3-hydroxyisobutyrate dehydrogenase-like beta-hydroxyacid dehydrogenase